MSENLKTENLDRYRRSALRKREIAQARWPEELLSRLKSLHAEGVSYSQISRELGVPKTTLRTKCVELGFPKRVRNLRKLFSQDQVSLLYARIRDARTVEMYPSKGALLKLCRMALTYSHALDRRIYVYNKKLELKKLARRAKTKRIY